MILANGPRVRTGPRREILMGQGRGRVTNCPVCLGLKTIYLRKQDI